MYGIVFGSSHCFQVFGIIALESFNELNCHTAGEEGVLAIGFLPASPARITEDVDVGRPECQSGIYAPYIIAEEVMVFGPCFIGDGRGHPEHQVFIKGGGQPYGLRKYRGFSGPCHTVQAFIPPVVGRYSQTRNGFTVVEELGDFLF